MKSSAASAWTSASGLPSAPSAKTPITRLQRRGQVLDLALRTELHDELVGALEQKVQDRTPAAFVVLPPARPLIEDEQGPGGERLTPASPSSGVNTGQATTLTHTGSPSAGSR